MANALRGLRARPQYEDPIGIAFPYGLEQLTPPNRNASLFKKWFYFITT